MEPLRGDSTQTPEVGAETEFARGCRLQQEKRHAEAAASFGRAITASPEDAASYNNLGLSLVALGRLDEAVSNYRRGLTFAPDAAPVLFNLGNALFEQGKWAEAEASYRQSLAFDPSRAGTHNNLGNALKERGRFAEAAESYRRAIALDPAHHRAHLNLGIALEKLDQTAAAAESYHRAIAIRPDYAGPYNNLAGMLKSQGRANEAAAYYRRAVELSPDNRLFHSNLLFCLQYDPAMTPGALLVAHRAYAASLPKHIASEAHDNSRDLEKRFKIGYVSPDLRRHPVGYFMMPVVAAHDRERFAVHCYYGHANEDEVTAAIRSGAEVWRSTVGVTDDALAAMIRADGIDILVDLAGHTADNRLPAFAQRPAPVQATWAGYVGTTGLSEIDYLITDRWHSPPGAERYAVERLIRLPDGYICWAVPAHAPEIGPSPATTPGAVTFGCFNNLAKINPPVIALWSRLLRDLTQSRLVLKTSELGNPVARERLLALFEAEGVAAARLTLEGRAPQPELLARYNDIDIGLDPFPYSGGVTTIEALWMGVPVVTMPGERFASRHSLSHLSNIGLEELVADGPDDYLRIAAALARDLPRLQALRRGLRNRMRASPLLQSQRFTRGLEETFRAMWRSWCGAGAAQSAGC